MEDNNINNTDENVNLNENPTNMAGVNNKKGFTVPLIVIIISFMIIIISLIAIILMLNKAKEAPKVEIEKVEEEKIHQINGSEPDTYHEENLDETLGEFAVEEKNTFSEAELVKFLTERGMYDEETTSIKITTSYDMDGNVFDEKEILETSKERHPKYKIMYEGGYEYSKWEISIVGKEIIAYPTVYNENPGTGSGVLMGISEKDSFVSYDEKLNKFSRQMPDKKELELTKVEKIDRLTLDQLVDRSSVIYPNQ